MTVQPGGPASVWTIEHVAQTGSTNADLVARAAAGASHRLALVADVQTAGRGRLGRTWEAPVGSALLMSILLRPRQVPLHRRSWIGSLLAMAICTAMDQLTGLTARVKWPNDVLIDGRKVAGILAEHAGDAVVVGCGINVTVGRDDLPRADATSLALEGAHDCERERLRDAVLVAFDDLLGRWELAAGDMDASGLRAQYLAASASVGRRVHISVPDGRTIVGTVVDVASDGAIVIDHDGTLERLTAGDVTHASLADQLPGDLI